MKDRDVAHLLADHYDRLTHPPKPPNEIVRNVTTRLVAVLKVTKQLQGKENPTPQP